MQGPKVVGHRATKVCIMLDGCGLSSVRVARGLESALGVGCEFVVFVFSVVRHVDINLPRFANRGVVSWARTSARRSAKESAKEPPYLCWKEGQAKNVFGLEGGYRPRPARRANSLVHLPYPKAQCGVVFEFERPITTATHRGRTGREGTMS